MLIAMLLALLCIGLVQSVFIVILIVSNGNAHMRLNQVWENQVQIATVVNNHLDEYERTHTLGHSAMPSKEQPKQVVVIPQSRAAGNN